jgi:CubicO group peptidase (beta-lactamase class C family)
MTAPHLKGSVLLPLVCLLVLVGVGAEAAKAPPGATGKPIPKLVVVDRAVSALMVRWKVPGVSVGVVKDGRLVYARGFGYADREAGVRVQPGSRFRIASVSKPVTAVAVMKLLQDGTLDSIDRKVFGPTGILNDPIYADILDPRVTGVTVRDLLQHTAGWDSGQGYDPQYDLVNIARTMATPPPADSVNVIRYMLKNRKLDADPGKEYHYSNFGYNVLGRVIEKLTGLRYETYVRKQILDPVGAKTMRIGGDLPRDRTVDEVSYYETADWPLVASTYGTGEMVTNSYGGYHLCTLDAHGGWLATSTDLLRFMTAVDGFATKPDILDAARIELMTTPSAKFESNYALGWVVRPDGTWLHAGALTTGVYSMLVRQADGVEWAILCNRLPIESQDPLPSLETFQNEVFRTLSFSLAEVKSWPAHDLFSP